MSSNPFSNLLTELKVGDNTYKYYSLPALNDPRVEKLPYSIRILLESSLRNADGFAITAADVETILNWKETSKLDADIPFRPARVILQDFTGVPCVVDLAAMRDAVARLGGDVSRINPLVPVDLVIDHSVQVDATRTADAVEINLEKEMERNSERFQFLKWGSQSFDNLRIIPPGSGIVHQVNLEYLAPVVCEKDGVLYPDSVVGTDSHTTMIDGLGVAGWGVGGIEAEAVMLGQHVSMVLPQVIGFRLTNELPSQATATDLVLVITSMLRKYNVVGKFVEFYGPGINSLSLGDRATIANMAPEYGATMGFFPLDQRGLEYMKQTGRSEQHVSYVDAYTRAQGLLLIHGDDSQSVEPDYTDVIHLDLSTVVPTLAGPKRPHDAVQLTNMKNDFNSCLSAPIGFKGYNLPSEELSTSVDITYNDQQYTLTHGSVVIAAITSCTNTSNPSVLMAAGLLAQNAVKYGLSTKEYIKTSLAPGSHVATSYLESAGVMSSLIELGFAPVGYGCTTCIGNSGDIPSVVENAINDNNLVASAVLSGNRNFEGRVHPSTRANYLASPPLVVAYALAGTVNIDFETEPIGINKHNNTPVYLRDIWPTNKQVQDLISVHVTSEMFKQVYSTITHGTPSWQALQVTPGKQYQWDDKSTYIHHPPFFATMELERDQVKSIDNAYCLLNLGDSITTDHISPAGKIALNSPAGQYLLSRGVEQKDFNTYGARRGNDLVMIRGTFANNRIVNKLLAGKASARTLHVPTKTEGFTYDVAMQYKNDGYSTIILGGEMYGSGSSRDMAAKMPLLQGVRAVIAQSFERIHRSNLVGMAILPLQYLPGENADSLGLTGHEQFSIDISDDNLSVNQIITVNVTGNDKITSFKVKSRIDTPIEVEYYKHGGILQYVLRNIAKGSQ